MNGKPNKESCQLPSQLNWIRVDVCEVYFIILYKLINWQKKNKKNLRVTQIEHKFLFKGNVRWILYIGAKVKVKCLKVGMIYNLLYILYMQDLIKWFCSTQIHSDQYSDNQSQRTGVVLIIVDHVKKKNLTKNKSFFLV